MTLVNVSQGNHYTTLFRQYDPRIGRWMSIDPIIHANQGSYNAYDDNPVLYTDEFGDNAEIKVTESTEAGQNGTAVVKANLRLYRASDMEDGDKFKKIVGSFTQLLNDELKTLPFVMIKNKQYNVVWEVNVTLMEDMSEVTSLFNMAKDEFDYKENFIMVGQQSSTIQDRENGSKVFDFGLSADLTGAQTIGSNLMKLMTDAYDENGNVNKTVLHEFFHMLGFVRDSKLSSKSELFSKYVRDFGHIEYNQASERQHIMWSPTAEQKNDPLFDWKSKTNSAYIPINILSNAVSFAEKNNRYKVLNNQTVKYLIGGITSRLRYKKVMINKCEKDL